MSTNILSPISNFSVADEPIHLSEGEVSIGTLSDIIEPDGEDILLAKIAGELIELPRTLSASLWTLMGQRVVVVNVAGQIRVGLSTQ